jgi:putative transposase
MRQRKRPRSGGVRKLIEEVGDRVDLVRSLDRIGPFEVAYTDFTELGYGGGVAHFIPILDHATKVVLGWAVDVRATTSVALGAWVKAKSMFRRLGIEVRGVIVHHDRDPVFTSYRWVDQLLRRDEARVSYALRGARDNPEMESFFGRFKTENSSLFLDAETVEELIQVVGRRIRYYNWERRHSTLGNQAPMRYVKSLNMTK